ncbi:MAG: trigger factor [Sphingomonas sp.]|uniref:trigger factor n=1 Tax=Sphingomonas sp. TaxID=28214 RepID=UPI001ACA1007|nr:trigger factor [Sphingomonas sp.]MBN8807737.1 trigger factor [Sphingomonas sp.]
MQTVETLNEGLKRAYTLTITAKEIDAKVDAEVKKVAPQVRMPGFRPGKVPANLIRKMHGESLAQDALNSAIQEGIQKLIADNRLRPAMQPSVALEDEYAAGKDASLTIEMEVLPDVPTPSIDDLKLERLTVPADDAAVQAQLQKFAEQQKTWNDAKDGYKAKSGDLVTVDFVGKTADGVAFEGGTGTDMGVEIGSGRLIPGFEDQVIGVKTGDEKTINVTFPDDYPAENLKGQPATFDLTVKSVKTAGETKIDDALATSLGLKDLEQLTGLLKGQVEQELNGLTRTYMKRKLLDQLAAGHDFPVPPSMVEAEFNQIWEQLKHEATHEPDPAAALAEMEKERDDYHAIAERRVRLGLLLSEIGQANGVEVSQQEMNRLIAQAAQQYGPEDQKRFIQYIQQEPMAAAQLRAPLYEDKVVDFLFDKAAISDRDVTRAELEAAIESDDGFATGTHTHDHDNHKPKAKKAAAKKDAGEAKADTAEPAKKPAAKAKKADKPAAEPAATDDKLVEAEPVKKAATKKAPAKADAAKLDDAPAKKPAAKKAPAKK